MKIIVCDDEPLISDALLQIISKNFHNRFSTRVFHSYMSLMNFIAFEDETFDLLITDVHLKDGDGIEAAKVIQEKYPQAKVILMTGMIENSKRIFDIVPSDFIVTNRRRASGGCNFKGGTNRFEEKQDTIAIKTYGSEYLIRRSNSLYVENKGHKLRLKKEKEVIILRFIISL